MVEYFAMLSCLLKLNICQRLLSRASQGVTFCDVFLVFKFSQNHLQIWRWSFQNQFLNPLLQFNKTRKHNTIRNQLVQVNYVCASEISNSVLLSTSYLYIFAAFSYIVYLSCHVLFAWFQRTHTSFSSSVYYWRWSCGTDAASYPVFPA